MHYRDWAFFEMHQYFELIANFPKMLQLVSLAEVQSALDDEGYDISQPVNKK